MYFVRTENQGNGDDKMLVSIIMPAYNSEKFIRQAVDSILGQTFTNYELIVVEDCSTDKTLDILNEYSSENSRITLIRNEKNSGVSYSRNRAISIATGEYIAFLDSDDMWDNQKLEKQVNYVKSNPNADFVFTGSAFIDENDKPLNHILHVPDKISFNDLLKQNIISCSSVFIKRSIIQDIKMPNDKMHEDFATWLTILKNQKYAYGIDEPLLIYRLSSNSKSSNKIKAAHIQMHILYGFLHGEKSKKIQKNTQLIHYLERMN